MPVTFGFYNSLNGDRKYDAIQLSSIFDGIITDGVFRSIGDALKVTASTGMTVVVGEGRAWFDHTWTLNDTPQPLVLDAADAVLKRIDTVVLDIDTRTAVRANSISVVKGTPASNPVRGVLVQAGGRYQYPLCDILVNNGVTTILQSNITDLVGTAECPYATLIDASNEIGDRTYSAQNYIVNNESITESLDNLDTKVKTAIDNVAQSVANLNTSKQATITGAGSTVTVNNLSANKALVSNASGKIAASAVTDLELSYLLGLTGNIQAQLNSLGGGLTANRVIISDALGKLAASAITNVELSYLAGLTGNIQNQLNTISGRSYAANKALKTDASGNIVAANATAAEVEYLAGVTSAIQTQINGKQPTLTGAATSIASSNLTASRLLVSDASGKVAVSPASSVEAGYLAGVTSAIQTQLDGKLGATAQAADSLKVGGKKITVSTVAPTSPAVGDLWVDTN